MICDFDYWTNSFGIFKMNNLITATCPDGLPSLLT